ncbi:MAG: oxidoreductase, partial [Brevibacterium aurantiacum]|nr:oxidoreductase [Brevibacterium aurantiacum]
AKYAAHAVTQVLRLELGGEPIRVMELAPGLVHTEEFTLKRVGGSQDKADKVYEGVENPLTAEDVADAVVYSLTRPHHFNVDLMVIRPIAQAAQHKVARNTGL